MSALLRALMLAVVLGSAARLSGADVAVFLAETPDPAAWSESQCRERLQSGEGLAVAEPERADEIRARLIPVQRRLDALATPAAPVPPVPRPLLVIETGGRVVAVPALVVTQQGTLVLVETEEGRRGAWQRSSVRQELAWYPGTSLEAPGLDLAALGESYGATLRRFTNAAGLAPLQREMERVRSVVTARQREEQRRVENLAARATPILSRRYDPVGAGGAREVARWLLDAEAVRRDADAALRVRLDTAAAPFAAHLDHLLAGRVWQGGRWMTQDELAAGERAGRWQAFERDWKLTLPGQPVSSGEVTRFLAIAGGLAGLLVIAGLVCVVGRRSFMMRFLGALMLAGGLAVGGTLWRRMQGVAGGWEAGTEGDAATVLRALYVVSLDPEDPEAAGVTNLVFPDRDVNALLASRAAWSAERPGDPVTLGWRVAWRRGGAEVREALTWRERTHVLTYDIALSGGTGSVVIAGRGVHWNGRELPGPVADVLCQRLVARLGPALAKVPGWERFPEREAVAGAFRVAPPPRETPAPEARPIPEPVVPPPVVEPPPAVAVLTNEPTAAPTQPVPAEPAPEPEEVAPDTGDRAAAGAFTAADLVGPDGVSYPDFSRAGVPGGIPDVPARLRAEELGAKPNDDEDDAPAIQKAVDRLSSGRGGAVTLGPGRFVLDSTILVEGDGVVLRGAGRDKTVLVPRFKGQALSGSGGDPHMPLLHWKGRPHPQRVTGVLLKPAKRGDTRLRVANAGALIEGEGLFVGVRRIPPAILSRLGAPLRAMHEEGYARSVQGGYFVASGRLNFGRIHRVNGDSVTLDRPLRADFPMDLEPYFDMSSAFVRGGGVEDLRITQPDRSKTQIDAITFERVDGGWVRRVDIGPIGSWPLGLDRSVQCEVRDCHFNDTHVRGGGGVGYVGLNYTYDTLIDGCRFERLRHLSLSMHSTGNVIRRTQLGDCDINFHLEWPSETLLEQCVVNSGPFPGEESRGSYGLGIYTPRHSGDIHMPSGPRHVFYANEISSPKESVSLGGGGSSGNVFAYNRFVAESRPGVILRSGADDNLFLKNVFVLRRYDADPGSYDLPFFQASSDPEKPNTYVPGGVLFLETPASGNRFVSNRFLGVPPRELFVGVDKPAASVGNVVSRQSPHRPPDAPAPPVPSLYAWQRSQRGLPPPADGPSR